MAHRGQHWCLLQNIVASTMDVISNATENLSNMPSFISEKVIVAIKQKKFLLLTLIYDQIASMLILINPSYKVKTKKNDIL